MAAIDDELARLAEAASKLGLSRFLRPGLSEEQIDEFESRLDPFRLPAEARALYRWHDGAEEAFSAWPPYRFLGLDEALREYVLALELMQGNEGWNPLWFPIFAFQGDYHLVVLTADQHAESPIYGAHNADTDIRQVFPDLHSYIATLADAYANGVLWMGDGYVEADSEMLREIAINTGTFGSRMSSKG
jgi:cell wall assembly regulator SMI1